MDRELSSRPIMGWWTYHCPINKVPYKDKEASPHCERKASMLCLPFYYSTGLKQTEYHNHTVIRKSGNSVPEKEGEKKWERILQ